MASRRLGRLATTALLTLSAFAAIARADELDPYSKHIDEVARTLVATIRPTLDERSRKIVDEIDFVSPASWVTNAEARRSFGKHRIVEFNAGFLAVTDWLSLALIADWDGHDGCLREYSLYLAERVGHNSKRVFRGRERRDVLDFTSYARATHGQCAGALQNPADEPRNDEIRTQIADAIIATVLLHEIGHHVLEHVSDDAYSTNFMHRRIREMAADQWAVATAVNANYDLRKSVPLFLFLAATGGGSLEDEIRSSHPSGLHRIRDLLVQTRALLDAKDHVSAHVMDASIDDLNRSLH